MFKRTVTNAREAYMCFLFIALLNCVDCRPDIYHVRPSGSRVIQPYSCHDPDTKEEGVCMFSWNCQRSNGTHLTYCMDRFYFGSCCKLPPGVYIATPPSIISNDVTVAQKYKPRPSTQRTTTDKSFDKHSNFDELQERRTTAKPFTKPTKGTDFPPGLVTWRPLEETVSTAAPVKKKPTKFFSTKPLFGSSTDRPRPFSSETTSRTPTASQKPISSTVVTRRKTRPTRPYGSTKRKTRPTRPYPLRNSTSSRVSIRRTRPTRPVHRPTSSVTSFTTQSSTSTIGTWANILTRSTPPQTISSTKRTTPVSTTRTVITRRPSTTVVTRATTKPTRISVYPTVERTTVEVPISVRPTRPHIASTTQRVPTTMRTKPTLPPTMRTKPSVPPTMRTKPTIPPTMRTKPTMPPTMRTKPTIPTTMRTTEEEPSTELTTTEIITFPPFPGVTRKTTKLPIISTTPKRRTTKHQSTTQQPSSTISIRTTEQTTFVPTSTIPSTTTQKSTPSHDYTEVCGRPMPGPVGRVVGGGNSYFGEWPWVVSLRQWKKNTFLHKCGATLLNEFWAITAAHCVENVPLTDILLRLGEYDISHEYEPFPFVERRVQIVASHPQFDRRTFEYDLALLRFYEPVTFQKNVLPVCVPSGNNSYVGKYATVTGWGRLYEDGPLPDVIQEVALPVITNKLCETMYRQAGFVEDIPDIFICAGYADGGKDSCEGDSGGPMVIQEDDGRWVLAGVISWGIGCALPNQPGVYTRITKFADWINQIIIF